MVQKMHVRGSFANFELSKFSCFFPKIIEYLDTFFRQFSGHIMRGHGGGVLQLTIGP